MIFLVAFVQVPYIGCKLSCTPKPFTFMKNFTVGITLFLCIFIQSCTEEPNGLQSKKELSKNELKTVLESSEQFNNLIALRVAFH